MLKLIIFFFASFFYELVIARMRNQDEKVKHFKFVPYVTQSKFVWIENQIGNIINKHLKILTYL